MKGKQLADGSGRQRSLPVIKNKIKKPERATHDRSGGHKPAHRTEI
ncbi:MAG TPA: hypothetical protein VF450_00710 [Noviherbaspirillum sp.]